MAVKKEKGENMMVVNLASHKVPKMTETTHKEGYVNYGEDNRYPDYLIELFNRSSKHNAIITGKVNYIFGKGFAPKQGNVQALMDKFGRTESLNEVALKAVTTLEIFDGLALEIIWNKGKKGFEVNHLDFNNVRSNIDHSMFYYATDWTNYRSIKDCIKYKPFNPDDPTGKQLFYYKCYRPGILTYPLPSYIGSIPYIETDIEISNFHLNNIKNGFWGGQVVTFVNGQPTKEEQDQIKKKFERTKTGTDNAGRFILNFVDNKDRAPILEPLVPSENDKMFDILNDTVLQEIFIGHKVTSPMLFGVRTEGQLGGRAELLDAHELFNVQYRQPRAQIHEKIFNFLVEIQTGVRDALQLTPLELFAPPKLLGQPQPTDALVNGGNKPQPTDGLKPQPTDNVDAKLAAFPKMETVKQVFSKYGTPKKDATVLMRRRFEVDGKFYNVKVNGDSPFAHIAYDDLTECELDFATESKLTPIDKMILDYLSKDPLIDNIGLANALKISTEEVASRIDKLENKGLLDNRTLTDAGNNILKTTPPPTSRLATMYEYALDPLAPPLKPGGESRDFCKYMMELDRLFTRQDIEGMSSELGYDVWRMRGGWYHNPVKDVNVPHCRHQWNQVLVVKK